VWLAQNGVRLRLRNQSQFFSAARVPLLVLDHAHCPVDPATIAWITSLLPERPKVLLWQATDGDLARLNAQVPPTRSWYAVSGADEAGLLSQAASALARREP
jgi:hypothetical protein